jgi:Recombination endonuclease VII
MSRVCNVCGVEKNISDFYSGRNKCKDCVNSKARKIRIDHPERYAKYIKRHNEYLKERRYGITQEEFDIMLVDQNNMCKICNTEFKSTKDTHIDHCHDTNIVRGLLCNNCNLALGQFNDNTDNMDNAIRYLLNS